MNPRRDESITFVEKALDDWEMKGLKLHPIVGFHLHDDETYALLNIAAEYDMSVLTVSGPISAPLYSKYSHSLHLDRVLVDYPNLDTIVVHIPLGWWRNLHAIVDIKINTNLHVDISGWQDRAKKRPEEFAHAVRRFVDSLIMNTIWARFISVHA